MNESALKSRPGRRTHWLQVVVHVAAWIPLLVLIFDFSTGNLTFNPIQAATQRTGDIAIILLILSLACTPVHILFRYSPALRVRRALGLYAYMYAGIHLFIYAGLDYRFDLSLIGQSIIEKRFIVVGSLAFLILSALALTSFRWWKVRLRKNWKQLHRFVYLANLLVVLHFAWAVKGDIFRLQGDIMRPLLAGLVVAILLALRIPAIKRRLAGRSIQTTPPGKPDQIFRQQPDQGT